MQLRVRLQIGFASALLQQPIIADVFSGLAVSGFLNGLNGWGLFAFAYDTTKTCTQITPSTLSLLKDGQFHRSMTV